MPFRAVLLDFGGVYTPSPFSIFVDFAAELGADPERVLGLVFGPYDRDTDHPWHRLERGELTLLDAREAIIALAKRDGLAFDPLVILARMAGSGRAREAGGAADRRLAARRPRAAPL